MPSTPPFSGRASQLIRPSLPLTGERRDLFISGAPAIHDGQVVGISCIARDITERIQTEKALRRSEARYRELIHALPAAVYTTDGGAASRSTTKLRSLCGGASRKSARIYGADRGRSISRTAPRFHWMNVRWPSHYEKAGPFAAKKSSSNGLTARDAMCCRTRNRSERRRSGRRRHQYAHGHDRPQRGRAGDRTFGGHCHVFGRRDRQQGFEGYRDNLEWRQRSGCLGIRPRK